MLIQQNAKPPRGAERNGTTMKKNTKLLAIALAAVLAACAFVGCGGDEKPESPTPDANAVLASPSIYDDILNSSDAQFLRVNSDGQQSGEPVVIRDAETFKSQILPLIPGDQARTDAEAKYNAEYFKKFFVVAAKIYVNSGSTNFKLSGITTFNGKINISIASGQSGVGTSDMATFLGLISLSSEKYDPDMPINMLSVPLMDNKQQEQ